MFPKKKYQIIYADPPWLFRVRSEKGNKRSATNHYDVMSIQDIKDMPVQDIADENCILFLWVTFPNLIEGIDLSLIQSGFLECSLIGSSTI